MQIIRQINHSLWPDTSYVYDYEVSTEVGGHDQNLNVNAKGKATVGVIAPCEFVLTVSNY